MIRLRRTGAPGILVRRGSDWTRTYLERVAAAEANATRRPRPPSRQYGHGEVRQALRAISHCKCFYCECRPERDTVDHYEEVAAAPERAFDWANLYLACDGCQDKLAETTVAGADCLDPCSEEFEPAEHLLFVDEVVKARRASRRGSQTIVKYQLNRPELELKRMRALRSLDRALLDVQDRMLTEGRTSTTAAERDVLLSYFQSDGAFSAMFRDKRAAAPPRLLSD